MSTSSTASDSIRDLAIVPPSVTNVIQTSDSQRIELQTPNYCPQKAPVSLRDEPVPLRETMCKAKQINKEPGKANLQRKLAPLPVQTSPDLYALDALRFYFWKVPFIYLIQIHSSAYGNLQLLYNGIHPSLSQQQSKSSNRQPSGRTARYTKINDHVGSILQRYGKFLGVSTTRKKTVVENRKLVKEIKKEFSSFYASSILFLRSSASSIGFLPSVYWYLPAVHVFGVCAHHLFGVFTDKADRIWFELFECLIDQEHPLPTIFIKRFFNLHFRAHINENSDIMNNPSVVTLPTILHDTTSPLTQSPILRFQDGVNVARSASYYHSYPVSDLGSVISDNYKFIKEELYTDLYQKYTVLTSELFIFHSTIDIISDSTLSNEGVFNLHGSSDKKSVTLKVWNNISEVASFLSQLDRCTSKRQVLPSCKSTQSNFLVDLYTSLSTALLTNSTSFCKENDCKEESIFFQS